MSPLIKITNEVFVRKSEVLAVTWSCDDKHLTNICMKHGLIVHVENVSPEQVQKILEGKEETTNETTD